MIGEELSIDEQIAQYIEATTNPFKFLKYVRILDAERNEIILFEPWEHLINLLSLFLKHRLIVVLKTKQAGMSWLLAAYAVWTCYKTGANVLMISRGENEAADLLGKSKFIHSQLPRWLQLEKEHDGMTMISFKSPKSRIVALSSAASSGVGQTSSLVIRDELDFQKEAESNFASLMATIVAGGQMIDVSTRDKTAVNSHFIQEYMRAKRGENDFYPVFLPYNVRPGRTEEWYKEEERKYPIRDFFLANFPRTEEEALSSISQRGLFDIKLLDELIKNEKSPLETRYGTTRIYHRPKVGTDYIAGADIAEGRGGDYSVLWIEGREGLQRELVSIIRTNLLTIDLFAYQSFELLREYFNPFLICGNDAFGLNYLDNLLKLGYTNIYYEDRVRNKPGYPDAFTSDKRRNTFLDLDKALRAGLVIRDKEALIDFVNFQITEAGRFEAARNAYDDCVCAAAKCNAGWGLRKPPHKITVSYY